MISAFSHALPDNIEHRSIRSCYISLTIILSLEGGRPEVVSKLDKMWPPEISVLPKEPVDNWNYLHAGMLHNQHCIASNAKHNKNGP